MRRSIFTLLAIAAGACRQGPIASDEPVAPAARATALAPAPAAAGDLSAAFLEALHGGRYEALPEVLRGLTAAYAADRRDPRRSLHLGLAHLWRIAESSRAGHGDPGLLDSVVLAEHYLTEASRLDAGDPRIPCWQGSARRSLGRISGNDDLVIAGLAELRESAARHPAFGLFCLALPAAHASRAEPLFVEGLAAQWRSLEICTGRAVDPARPPRALPPGDPASIPPAIARACFDSPIAPHNREGFLLNMGDLVVKSGDAEVARTIYGWARSSPEFATWPYRATLEERIARADERARAFDAAEAARRSGRKPSGEPEIMSSSAIACAACHQR